MKKLPQIALLSTVLAIGGAGIATDALARGGHDGGGGHGSGGHSHSSSAGNSHSSSVGRGQTTSSESSAATEHRENLRENTQGIYQTI